MAILADIFPFFIVALCLVGLSLAGKEAFPGVDYALHFCFTPLLLVAVLFCLEHYVALGQAPFLWIPGSLLSLMLIYRHKKTLLKERVLWYFLAGYLICFFWRFSFPDINPVSERVADHAHLVSYSQGGLLPAEDIWLKGNKDDMYYILQYYAGGLLHRWIGTGSGLTYQLAYCVLTGLALAGVGSGVAALARSTWAGALTVLAIGLGGPGTTLAAPFMVNGDVDPEAAMRFIGSFAVQTTPMNPIGHRLVQMIGESPVDAPMEYYSYLIFLGDYHPSLSSLFFFGLGFLAMGVAEYVPRGSATDRYCVMGGVATAVFLLISNTWIAPLQIALILTWLVYRRWSGKPDSLSFLVTAWLVPFALIYPFFSQFANETVYEHVKIEWVKEHAPLLNWLLVMGPAVLLWAVSFARVFRSRIATFAAIVGAAAMAGTYFFYVHDVYGGQFAIFNTTLKWWPWAYALLTCFGIAVCWEKVFLRGVTIALIAVMLAGNVWIMGRSWYDHPKNHAGRLDGYAWFTDTEDRRGIYEVMRNLPKGVALESVPADAPGPCLTIAQFTGHYSAGGWIGHEMLWRGARIDLARLQDNRDAFYRGELQDPLAWLQTAAPGGVDYIVWQDRDNARAPHNWYNINEAIKSRYDWKLVNQIGDTYWGIWIRRTRP